jgi:hypothetical protein
MKKTLNFLLISLAIFTVACSNSSDVQKSSIETQRQIDKDYEEASAKSQVTETSKPKATDAPTPKATDAPTPKATDAPTTKAAETTTSKAAETTTPKAAETTTPKAAETDKSQQDKLLIEISSKIKKAALDGTLEQLNPINLCSSMPKDMQYMCTQKVSMDIQSEMSKIPQPSQHSKNERPKVDPNAKDPCAAVPKSARAECEKGIADMRKETEEAKAKEAKKAQLEADKYVKNFDRNNIPKIAKFNFTELDKFSRMSKIRSAVGHNYSYKTDEDDPSRQNCKSMKHYLIPKGAPRSHSAYSTTPHTFKWMSIKFYAPVDGFINHVEYSENNYGTEANFGIQATETDAKGYYFDYYHIALDPNLKVGSTVKAGQQIGTLGDENSYGEIAVSARISKTKIHLISFLEVATDEIFNLYKSRGINSPADVIITREERDAKPLACDQSEAGWFIGSSRSNKPDISFQKWVFESEDNWFFFK